MGVQIMGDLCGIESEALIGPLARAGIGGAAHDYGRRVAMHEAGLSGSLRSAIAERREVWMGHEPTRRVAHNDQHRGKL